MRTPLASFGWWGAVLGSLIAMVAIGPSHALAQVSAPGTRINNTGTVRYQTVNGHALTPATDLNEILIGHLVDIEVSVDNDVHFGGAGRLVLQHRVTNRGNAPDTVLLTLQPPPGWQANIYLDSDDDGRLTGNDLRLSGRLALGSLQTRGVLVEYQVLDRLSWGAVHQARLHGASATDPGVTDVAHDIVRGPPVALELEKSVEPAVAAPGDTVRYTVHYTVRGQGTADSVRIADVLPAGMVVFPESLRLNGQAFADAGATAEFASNAGAFSVALGSLAAGTKGQLSFDAALPLQLGEGQAIDNVAEANWSTPAGADSTASPPARLTATLPEISIEKKTIGPDPLSAGDTLHYRIVLRNLSGAHAARGLMLTDTIATLLEPLASESAQTVGQIARWTDLRIAAGDSLVIDLPARIRDTARDGDVVTNRASVGYPNGPSWSDEAEPRHLLSGKLPKLGLQLRAEVMQVQMGDRVPMTLLATNEGEVGLRDVVIRASLPEGTALGPMDVRAYARTASAAGGAQAVAGLTSKGFASVEPLMVERQGREIAVHFRERIGPGEALAFTFEMAVIDPEGPTIEIEGHALGRRGRDLALGEAVASNLDRVWLRLTQVRPVETRTLIGKVWADWDGDGRQQDNEPGVPGVEVWTEDGQVARTDAAGKYSFVNIRPGRHVIRLVPATLPVWAEVAGSDALSVDADGWTTPRVNFRVVARIGRAVEIALGADEDVPEEVLCMFRIQCILSGEVAPPDTLAADSVHLALERRPEGAGSWVWRLPEGWDVAGPAAWVHTDTSGGRWLEWARTTGSAHLVLVRTGSDVGVPSAPYRLEPLIPAEERANDTGAFLHGPAPRIFAPEDGVVLGTDRLFVGARGEPMHVVELFDGERSLGEAQLRPDGIHDYINVQLSGPGTHVLRLRMKNSWGQERWDSVRVHVSGAPARVEAPAALRVRTHETHTVRARLLDEWGVPVRSKHEVTVRPGTLRLLGTDASSSVGHQVLVGADGTFEFVIEAPASVDTTKLVLVAGNARAEIPVSVLPALRPLQVTAVGQMGAGSAPEAFGAVSARGSIGNETALTLSFDSRRLDAGREAFGRDSDPLEEGRYPILGDASERQDPASARGLFSARIERDHDYLAWGDLDQGDFSEGLALAHYRRAITGAGLRFLAGPVTLQAFGSMSGQALRSQLLRGDGTSGPYLLGESFIQGTERVAVQVRDPLDATRVVVEQVLVRYVDYEVDAQAGRLLLKRPLPATNAAGHPTFLALTYEADAAADASPVWGVRARAEIGDSTLAVPLGLQYVRDDMTQGGFEMAAGELGVRALGVDVQSELAYAATGEQDGLAARVRGQVSWFDGRVQADAEWRSVGEDFVNPADRSLRGGMESLAAGASGKLGDATVSVRHEREDFGPETRERERSEAALGWALGKALHIKSAFQSSAASRDTLTEETQAIETRATLSVTKHVKTWLEGRLQVAGEGSPLQGGNYAGGGASVGLGHGISLEARHLLVRPDGSEAYSLTSLGVRSETSATGTRVWGNYQIQGGIAEAENAAVLGLGQQLRLGDVTLNAMFERRDGVEHAPLLSHSRALPYGEPQGSYWSAGLGAEYLPKDRPYRLAARLEWKDGTQESSKLASLTGDVTIGGSLALLGRQQWNERTSHPPSGSARETSLLHSVFGLAYRPTWSDGVNALFKVDWKSEVNPTSGLLTAEAGESERLILAGEVIWSPAPALEIGIRYGRRLVSRHVTSSVTGDVLPITTDADFAGARAELRVTNWAALRFEAQALRELASGGLTWSAAPSLVLPIGPIEIAGGQRFGPLTDPDLARHQGAGWFATVGIRLTESDARSLADFWRARLGH